jgi:hypothetical protein
VRCENPPLAIYAKEFAFWLFGYVTPWWISRSFPTSRQNSDLRREHDDLGLAYSPLRPLYAVLQGLMPGYFPVVWIGATVRRMIEFSTAAVNTETVVHYRYVCIKGNPARCMSGTATDMRI